MKTFFTTVLLFVALAVPAASLNQASVQANTNSLLLWPTPSAFFHSNLSGFGPAIQTDVNPATNTYAGISAALTFNPATNTYIGISNALGGFAPATNTYTGITNALKFGPATNTLAGIVSALGYGPTQLGGTNAWTGTNKFANPNNEFTGSVYTNNGYGPMVLGLVWIVTNTATGTLPTGTAPNGSILTSTNGSFYVRSNNVWVAK